MFLAQIAVPCSQNMLNESLYIQTPTKTLQWAQNLPGSTFSRVELGTRCVDSTTQYAFIKRPLISGKSLLYEACIQQLVADRLTEIGFPYGAPRVTRLVALRDQSVGFAMEPIDGACTLDRYLDAASSSCLPNIIVDCLLQLCAMIWYLDQRIGINHRDLTPSNFLVIDHAPRSKILSIENEIIDLSSSRSLTLIDFGFSCLGSTETQVAELSLSTVYPASDPCPKEGRDLYLFLGLLYIDYYSRLPSQLQTLFESWLQDPGSNFCKFMRKDKESAKKWLYFMVGNEKITRFHSRPSRIVADLQSLM
jgi:serine/threonine protein kinase